MLVGDVYDAAGLTAAAAARPELVMQQLSDLPDERTSIPEFGAANARIRREGTRNLLAAARNAGAARFLVQSVAWRPPGDSGAAVEELERSVLAAGGVVLRYGQFYGPGTHYEQAPPPPPRVQIDEAARRTLVALDAPSGVLAVVGDCRRPAGAASPSATAKPSRAKAMSGCVSVASSLALTAASKAA